MCKTTVELLEKRVDKLEARMSNLDGGETEDYYIVLGFRNIPVNPNDVGIIHEAYNPFLFNSYEFAEKVMNAATERIKKDIDENMRAEIAAVKILTVCGH